MTGSPDAGRCVSHCPAKAMRGDGQRVVDAFAAWLEAGGWRVRREVDFCDLLASRAGATLDAEAKGRTAAIGLDVDTL